jgi:hypothetical protein
LKNEGKVFDSLDKLLSPSNSPIFPQLKLENLNDKQIDINEEMKKNKLTIITFSFSHYSTSNSEKWLQIIEEINNKDIKNFDVTVLNGIVFKFFRNYILKNYKNKTIEKRLENSFLLFGNLSEEQTNILGVENIYANYLFLVDKDLKIRWKCSGITNPKDIKKLKEFCNEILK